MLDIDIEFFESLRKLPYKEQVLKAALWYAAHGFKVIPLIKGTKKLGITEQYASSDPTIIKEWFTKDFIEGNISLLLLEHDVSVVDIDRHGDIDGFKNAGLVEADCRGLTAITPHHGLHLYVSGEVIYKSLPKGIEHKTTRVIVPPSVIDGVPYEWRSGGAPQELPNQLQRAFRGLKLVSNIDKPIVAQPSRDQIYAGSNVQGYAPTPVAPIGYVKRLLEYMDPGCDYDLWSKIGMAMHHNDDSDISMEAWREFSSLSTKYKIGECEKKWESFNQFHDAPITLRWLILTAKEYGCPDSPEDIIYYGSNLQIDMVVEEINKICIYRPMRTGGRICFLAKTPEGPLELCQWPEREWKSYMQNQYILVGDKPILKSELWLHHKQRRTGPVSMWEKGEAPPNSMNLYNGLAIEPVPCKESEIQFFLDFTLNVICRGNREYHLYLLDLLAQKMQHPLDVVGVCLVLQGDEGTGKGSLCRVMETIVGQMHSRAVSERKSLVGDYAGGLIASAVWVTANEAIWAGHPGEAERLKAIITEPYLEWNEKHVPMWMQRNCIFLSVTTNNNWAIPAELNSRRFFVLRIADDKAKNEAYWIEFNALLGRKRDWTPTNPEYMGKVLYYLQQRKITSSFINALETNWLMEQRGQTILDSQDDAFVNWMGMFGQDPVNDAYASQISDYSFLIVERHGEKYILVAKLYPDYRQYIRRHFPRCKPYTHEKFNRVLQGLGMQIERVKKESLTLGQSKFPNRGNAESQIKIINVLPPDALEKALAAKFKLLTPDTEDDED